MAILSTSSTAWYQDGNPNNPLNQSMIQAYAHATVASGVTMVGIDIEASNFTTDIRTASQATVNADIAKFQQIVAWLKAAEPTLKVGIYGYPYVSYWAMGLYGQAVAYNAGQTLLDPAAGYWATMGHSAAVTGYQAFQKANDALKPLLAVLDFAAPDLYTHYDVSTAVGLQDWEIAAKVSIDECRRVMPGKPVLPYIMPEYTPETSLGGTYLPASAWQAEVNLAYTYADGAVIWGGWDSSGRETWNSNAAWWQVIATGAYKTN